MMIEIIIIFMMLLFNKIPDVYVPGIDLIICKSKSTCIHEEGHRLDFKLGQPSQTEEFKEMVSDFPILRESKTSCLISNDYCFYSEMYALLYQSVEEEIDKLPLSMRKFYEVVR